MKKKIFLTLALVLSLTQLYAKDKLPSTTPVKIGYADMDYIFDFLPEYKTIASEYSSFENQLKNQLETRIGEFQQKAQAFQQGHEAMTEAVRNKKQSELQQLQGGLEKLELELQEKRADKYTSLVKPIQEKITKAIEQVAKKYGYTHVLNSNVGMMPVLLYADEAYNISDRVLKHLGVDPAKAKRQK